MKTMHALLSGALLALVVLGGYGFSAADVSVSIIPSTVMISPDSEFTVNIWKDSVDVEFDGYETVITFDPYMLELTSAREESVMTDSCWNRWWIPVAGEDSIFISHVLMCGGISVTGPGALSSLTFRALEQGTTTISCDYFWFTQQGIWVKDVAWHDGDVIIDCAGIDDDPGLHGGSLGLAVCPNPGRTFTIHLYGPANIGVSGRQANLDVYDVSGHVIRTLWSGTCHQEEVFWDGGSEDGCEVPPGVYFLRLSTPGRSVSRKIVLTR